MPDLACGHLLWPSSDVLAVLLFHHLSAIDNLLPSATELQLPSVILMITKGVDKIGAMQFFSRVDS